MNEHDDLLLSEREPFELPAIENLFNGLQFGEVVSASDSAEQLIEIGRFEIARSEKLLRIAFPSMFEIETKLSAAVELAIAASQVRREQGHAATDVLADQVRVNYILSDKGSADGRAFARMHVRKSDRQNHPIKSGYRVDLAHCFTL